MNLKNNISFLFILTLSLFSCSSSDENSDNENFLIEGKITGAANKTLYLEAMSQDGTIDVAQTETDEDGNFELVGNIPDMGIYQLRLGEGDEKIIPLTLIPEDEVELNSDFSTYATSPNFSGTEWAKPLTTYMNLFNEFAIKQSKMAQEKSAQMTEAEMMAKYKEFRQPIDRFAKKQMQKEPSNPVNIILSSSLSPTLGFKEWDPGNLDIMKTIGSAFLKRFPNSPIAQNMSTQAAQLEGAYAEFKAYEQQEKSGILAPEITMKNPEGKTLKLSDLKGKYVLIDFWASWCGPCRKENPNIVRLYKEYKEKGFTIFSVSLDQDGAAWKNAILADGLVWPYHVSDLLAWNTPLTQTYAFNSIPHTVLIDREGKIIARNLRGESLEQKLKEIL
jgi:thiol-disulfide isomerase/thioredoxin